MFLCGLPALNGGVLSRFAGAGAVSVALSAGAVADTSIAPFHGSLFGQGCRLTSWLQNSGFHCVAWLVAASSFHCLFITSNSLSLQNHDASKEWEVGH